jgi:tetratricopeptide (TPR) repeat protein
MIHGRYLRERGDHEPALAQFREAEKLKPGVDTTRDFEIGLALFDMKRYDEARQYAKRVYARKYRDNELQDKLKSVNQWGQ